MKYTIGFKSGNQLEVDVGDGAKFVSDVVEGVSKNPHANVQIYIERGLMLLVSDIEFICPTHIVAQSHQRKLTNGA